MLTKTRVLYASKLLGAKVNCSTDEEVGEISEIVIDGGIATYGIVKAGGGLLSSGSFYPVPFEDFMLADDEKALVTTFSKEVFTSAPHFEKDKWPDMGSEDWKNGVGSYFDGVRFK
ncbi:MAG TPA: PRC-barrel domain-containing protein [Dehalococcoidia bacterium]|nr:PRC-barrel domain-containing protein [Dehalococcoidia bacterium]